MINIMVAGVGGQGLVLATKIISQAGMKAGYDVKTNDVVGLSQRGGMVWGSVRIGEEVNSPNIPVGEGDIILGMEPLESLRWSYLLKDGGKVIVNTKRTYPSSVILEKDKYPDEDIEELKDKYDVTLIDALKLAKEAGNMKAANTIMIGTLAKYLDISTSIWEEVLRDNVPEKAVEDNILAFYKGYYHGKKE